MSACEWLSAAAALFFLVTSFFYVHKDAFYSKVNQPSRRVIIAHTVGTVLIGLATLDLLIAEWATLTPEMPFITISVIVVHSVRFVLDREEGRELKLNVERPSKYVFDAGANLAVIIFIVAVAHSRDATALQWLAFVLATSLIYKELYFRLFVDVVRRRLVLNGSSLKRNTKRPISHETSLYQGVFNRFTKSLFYIIVGYGLIYMIIDRTELFYAESTDAFKTIGASTSWFVDYCYFSLFQLLGGGYGEFAPVAALPKAIAISETFIGLIFIGLVLVKAVEALPRRPRNG